MQSGYGGVSEIQQFMVESCGPSLFSIASANPGAGAAPTDIHHPAVPHPLKYHPLAHSQPPALPPHFSHFHTIPITQQLFQQPAVHQFQLFHHHPQQQQQQQQYLEPMRLIPQHPLGLDQESGPENSASPTRIIPGGGGGGGGGGPSFVPTLMLLPHSYLSHRRRPLDIDYINRNNNKRCTDKEPECCSGQFSKKCKGVAECDHVQAAGVGSNYKLFCELEAIYKPGGGGSNAGGGANQTGSGSALTGDETPLLHVMVPPGLPAADRVGGTSETSAGEEAPAKKLSKDGGRRRRKRRQRQLSSVAAFLESLVKQLMDHQEGLHRKFLEVMERREQERTGREEAWRKQEAAKSCREAAARAQERALASSREAAIVSFLEKITGESLDLPPKPHFPEVDDADKEEEEEEENLQIEQYSETFNNGDPDSNKVTFNTSRWPKAEVQALIRVRSGLESRFQEPGLKGPLWEEVSASMAGMGYHRSAKRCKEKWENINKYFRKTKESGKKRPHHAKTCPYFQQLDQLYSKSLNTAKPPPHPSASPPGATANPPGDVKDHQPKEKSELLDAIVVPADHQGFRFSDMAPLSFDFDSRGNEKQQQQGPGVGVENNGDEDEAVDQGGGEEEEEEEEGERESQGEEESLGRRRRHQLDQQEEEEEDLRDSSLFFRRLQA
ncbi:hypothetical protein BHM03_00026534 [Ensete ventricosum]|uniref:Myb-like domain-containing protein n=1 Tax=Ensete ventricosum TaxID=4639 RepID=A0A445MHA7_ENSVE|nr:hypothetical protein BHM03_00026534 [Ensete ventricosum]